MTRTLVAVAIAAVAGFMTVAVADDTSPQPLPVPLERLQFAQSGTSCSAWKTICESRGPGCDAKFSQCMKSGCWVEGSAYGGARHCGLAKR